MVARQPLYRYSLRLMETLYTRVDKSEAVEAE